MRRNAKLTWWAHPHSDVQPQEGHRDRTVTDRRIETYWPLHKRELSKQDRRGALESMIKVTEKRADEEGHRKIKTRMVADGSKHRSYKGYKKSDRSLPTTRTDSVVMIGVSNRCS